VLTSPPKEKGGEEKKGGGGYATLWILLHDERETGTGVLRGRHEHSACSIERKGGRTTREGGDYPSSEKDICEERKAALAAMDTPLLCCERNDKGREEEGGERELRGKGNEGEKERILRISLIDREEVNQ